MLAELKALLRGPGPEAVARLQALLDGLAARGKGPFAVRTRRAGHTLLHLASRADNVDACRMLLPRYCIDMGNYRGETPLYLAAAGGAAAAVRFLLSEGADPCAVRGCTGCTPSEAAASPEIRAMLGAAAESRPFGGPRPVPLSLREAYLYRLYMQRLMELELAYSRGRQVRPDILSDEALKVLREEGLQGLARRCREAGRRAAAAGSWRTERRGGCARCGAQPAADPVPCSGRCRAVGYCSEACRAADHARHAADCAELSPGCHHCGAAGARPLKRCGRCRDATYCGGDCQKAAWALHKKDCRAPDPLEDIQRLASQGALMAPLAPAKPCPDRRPAAPSHGGGEASREPSGAQRGDPGAPI